MVTHRIRLMIEKTDKHNEMWYYKAGDSVYLPNLKDQRPSAQRYLWDVKDDNSEQLLINNFSKKGD